MVWECGNFPDSSLCKFGCNGSVNDLWPCPCGEMVGTSDASYRSHVTNTSSTLGNGDEVIGESFVRVMFEKVADTLRMERYWWHDRAGCGRHVVQHGGVGAASW